MLQLLLVVVVVMDLVVIADGRGGSYSSGFGCYCNCCWW